MRPAWLVKRAASPAPPERSRRIRLLTFLAALPPILAVAWVGGLWGPALLAVMVLAGGHTYSWRAAQPGAGEGRRPLVRLAVFACLHLALGWMCVGFSLGLSLPQAQFALYAQAVTAFDLRRRGNLFSSIGMSALVLYVAATLSRDTTFLLFVLAFAALALAVFYAAETEDGQAGAAAFRSPYAAGGRVEGGKAGPLPNLALFGLAGLGLSIAALVVTPRFAGRPMIPPFSINLPIRRGAAAQVINPAVPLVQINGVYQPDEAGDYYYGFDNHLDLRYRGRLSDQIVMYVRSPAWSYWRSHSYDTYNGYAWTQSDKSFLPLDAGGAIAFRVPSDQQALSPDEFTQSFYIVRDQPNLIFAAYRPKYVIINSEELVLDAGDGLRAGSPLQAGMAYSVISHRPEFSAEALRAAGDDYPPEIRARYLQLPDSLPPRVRDLARQVTAGAPTAYDRASALRDYLLTLEYDYDPPPQPAGTDAVDNFLFVDRRGVCEQFAAAHVILLRALGIPARLAAGYGAGEYNPFSGYYTVRASDAHAWTEVYFPGYGWAPFDPTPGWTPAPYTAAVRQWFLSGALEDLPGLPWARILSAGGALAGLAGGPALALAALGALAAGGYFLWRRLRRGRGGDTPLDGDPQRRRILAAYRAGQQRMRRFRRAPQTPREFAVEVGRLEWGEITRATEAAAYCGAPPAAELAGRSEALLRRLPRGPLLARLGLPEIRQPAWLLLPAPLTPAERRIVLPVAAVILAVVYGLMVSVSALLIGTWRLPLRMWLLAAPLVAGGLAVGAAASAWAGVRRQPGWLGWVGLGALGQAAAVFPAVFLCQLAMLMLNFSAHVASRLAWFLLMLVVQSAAFTCIGMPFACLLGAGVFAVAGWAWQRNR